MYVYEFSFQTYSLRRQTLKLRMSDYVRKGVDSTDDVISHDDDEGLEEKDEAKEKQKADAIWAAFKRDTSTNKPSVHRKSGLVSLPASYTQAHHPRNQESKNQRNPATDLILYSMIFQNPMNFQTQSLPNQLNLKVY